MKRMRVRVKMNSNQILILSVFLGYLLFNIVVSFVYSRRAEKSLHTTSEKKYFIGGRNMNGIVLAMTIMATYTSASSFISGPGAAGLTYGYAQTWIAAIQVPVTFLVLGVLGNKLAIVSRRTGAVTVVGYFKARYKSDALVVITSLGLIVDKSVYGRGYTYSIHNGNGSCDFTFDIWHSRDIVHRHRRIQCGCHN